MLNLATAILVLVFIQGDMTVPMALMFLILVSRLRFSKGLSPARAATNPQILAKLVILTVFICKSGAHQRTF